MLTSVARAALRRVVLTRTPATTTSNTVRILPIRSALQFRSFTSSETALEANAVAKKPRTSAGATKTAVARKTPAKKAAAKKKVAAKKPKAAKPKKKKAAPKPKKIVVKKVLTEEEKAAANIRELKKLALLKEPKSLPVSPWSLFLAKNQTQAPGSGNQGAIAAAYHDSSAAEMAELKATADANKIANQAQHLEWVESHPVEVIALANISRRALSIKTGKKHRPISDARLPGSHIRSGYNFYLADRLGGRGKDAQRFGEVASAWKDLSPEDKRPFNEMAEAEKTLITRQRKELAGQVKALKQQLRAESKVKPVRVSKTKITATNDIGL